MPKRSSNKPSDPNSLAAAIVGEATSDFYCPACEPERLPKALQGQKFNHGCPKGAAQALGRLGGLKGGKARAASLTPEQRKATAKKAAEARWRKKKT